MSFFDIYPRRNYQDFLNQRALDKPYKDSNGVYPLGDRKYSMRHWRWRDDGSIDICYTNRQTRDKHERGEISPHSDWVHKRRLATVHPDNTVEFHNIHGIGDAALLGSVFGVNIYHEARRGGHVIAVGDNIHPVIKGVRYNLRSFDPAQPYTILHRRLNRKKTKAVMPQYDEFRTVAKVLIEPMDIVGFRDVHETVKDEPIEAVFDMIDRKHYVDAVVRWAYERSWQWRWAMQHGDRAVEMLKQMAFNKLESDLNEAVYYKHDCFDYTECEVGKLQSSVWKHKIIFNGEEAERL